MPIEQADILMVGGNTFISKMIKKCTQKIGEEKTVINHVGIFPETYSRCVIEALNTVVCRDVIYAYGDADVSLAIFRAKNISKEDKAKISKYAFNQVGKKYGYLKIVAHFMDWVIGDYYFFRRLTHSQKYPICSWLVAYAYASAGYNFGVKPGQATPDDIWDFCINNPDKYECVLSSTADGRVR